MRGFQVGPDRPNGWVIGPGGQLEITSKAHVKPLSHIANGFLKIALLYPLRRRRRDNNGTTTRMNKVISEDAWLDQAMGKSVFVFLGNGICLRGKLAGRDDEAIFMSPETSEMQGATQMVYKAFISTIQPCAQFPESYQRHAVRI